MHDSTNRLLHLRPRREKVFKNHETRLPLDREAKVRIMHLARCLKRRTEPGKHYGSITGKAVDVLHALVWLIHDGRSGQCNPSYETIAGKAACARSTVCEAIRMLELAGVLSWVNRIHRIRDRAPDLFGGAVWRVVRTSNAYVFRDPKSGGAQGISSKSELRTGLMDEVKNQPQPPLDPALAAALGALGQAIEKAERLNGASGARYQRTGGASPVKLLTVRDLSLAGSVRGG